MQKIKNYIRVPYGQSVHGAEEINAVNSVLKSSTQMGKSVFKFENKIAKLFQKKYGLMVNSGSSALLLAFEALNLPKGSEVITPTLTFATTVSYILKYGLKPVFVDVDQRTYCANLEQIKNKISKNTSAIIAPHLLGNIVDWEKVKKFCQNKKIKLIEDSADTLGAKIRGKLIGKYTDVSITSFYGSHIINGAGNGGMVCFNDKKIYHKAKLLRSWGRSSSLFDENSEKIENRFNIKLDGIPYDKKFVFQEIGHNLEPSEISAAFGLVQLKNLSKNIKKRILVFKAHNKFFDNLSKHFITPISTPESISGWLAYPILIAPHSKIKRNDLQIFLEKRNIQTRVVFTGNILRQPGFSHLNKPSNLASRFINADYVMKKGMLIACHHGLNDQMLNHLHGSFISFLKQKDLL